MYPLLIGWRFFRAGSGNRLVSFVSLLAMAGLVLGVALMIVVMSVMNGFDREMRTRILGLVPHIQLYGEGGIENWRELRGDLLRRPEVLTVEPFVRVAGMLNYHGRVTGVELLGVDETATGPYQQLGDLNTATVSASTSTLTPPPAKTSDRLLISEKIAAELQVEEGAQLVLLAPRAGASGGQTSRLPAMRVFTVAGIFSTHTTIDKTLVITTLATAADIAGLSQAGDPGGNSPVLAQGLQLKVSDVFNARNTGYELLSLLPPGFGFVDWMQSHGNLYQAIQMSRKLVGLLVFAVIAVAVFNVIAMLVMTVVEKRPAIAILKTQGASRFEILQIFLVQGSLIGVFGVALGCVFGVLGSLGIENLMTLLQSWTGVQLLNLEVYPIDYIPADLRSLDVILVAVVALGLNLLAALYPAWKASAVMPGQVLRYE
ncbi:MAG: FtsX-like permease family protein [Porticoccaceae bacterium]